MGSTYPMLAITLDLDKYPLYTKYGLVALPIDQANIQVAGNRVQAVLRCSGIWFECPTQ